jgi:hypothetical protein
MDGWMDGGIALDMSKTIRAYAWILCWLNHEVQWEDARSIQLH